MSNIINEYYQKSYVTGLLLKQKLDKLSRNKDIAQEFEYWISNKQYKQDDCISVEGYTAYRLSQLSEYLVGESSFLLLIELREKPQSALKKIAQGFVMK